MTSHRPYRPALEIDVATQELIINKGVLYHPDVVDALVTLITKKGYQIPK
ncbi:hypothetical protein SDC9_184065 [bioreactor metagenome]|uniref:Uncharacterized protein n=1 Tax=bioreactor metagenome TaxID=1076179 RepID=A0A645HDE9_9ZZZZ